MRLSGQQDVFGAGRQVRLVLLGEFGDGEGVPAEGMVFWIVSLVGLATAYLLGSFPTGYLAGKLLKNIDVREHGSKSSGATNVLRTLGKWPVLVVLIVDMLKGTAAIIFALWFYPWFYEPSFLNATDSA